MQFPKLAFVYRNVINPPSQLPKFGDHSQSEKENHVTRYQGKPMTFINKNWNGSVIDTHYYWLIHSPSLTWNLKMIVPTKRNLLFQGLIFRFHVKLHGGSLCPVFQDGHHVSLPSRARFSTMLLRSYRRLLLAEMKKHRDIKRNGFRFYNWKEKKECAPISN